MKKTHTPTFAEKQAASNLVEENAEVFNQRGDVSIHKVTNIVRTDFGWHGKITEPDGVKPVIGDLTRWKRS